MQYSKSCSKKNTKAKNVYICSVKWFDYREADILESVFAVLTKKYDSFKEERTTNSTHFLCSYATMHISCISHTIQVWGIASFITAKVFPQPSHR